MIYDGTRKVALKLIKKVFPKLNRHSSKELSNTSVSNYWNESDKTSRIWIMLPSVTPLQIMRLAYHFQTEPKNITLTPDFTASPNCDKCWWNVDINNPNSTTWEWKP